MSSPLTSAISTPPAAAQRAKAPARVQYALSRDELYVMQRALRLPRLPGFDTSWAKAEPDGSVPHDIERMLQGATDALVTRRYLKLVPAQEQGKPPTLQIPPAIIATLGACAFSRYSVLLILSKPKGVLQTYLGQYRQIGVAHSIPSPEVHVFEALPGRRGVDAALAAQLTLVNQAPMNLPEGVVSLAHLKQGREAAAAGHADAATTLFISGGMPAPIAQAFSDALRDATARCTLAIAGRLADGQEVNFNAALVVSPTSCFLLHHNTAQSDIVRVQPTSADALRVWLKGALDQFPSVASAAPATQG